MISNFMQSLLYGIFWKILSDFFEHSVSFDLLEIVDQSLGNFFCIENISLNVLVGKGMLSASHVDVSCGE